MITIYHNPRCGKSREALALLEATGEEISQVLYMTETPSPEEINELINILGIKPMDLVRTKESLWKERYKGKKLNRKQITSILSKNPQLIERPVVIKDGKAIIARPAENIKEIL